MRFIHAADIHLDSPMRGLEAYPGAPAERLRIATRQAFDRVVDLCLEEQVDFLILAGDLFDTEVKDFHAALAAAAQLRRLNQAHIPVYLILGNHDSHEEMTAPCAVARERDPLRSQAASDRSASDAAGRSAWDELIRSVK